MQLQIKNEGMETHRIRVIPPNSQYFTVKFDANPISLAPGISLFTQDYQQGLLFTSFYPIKAMQMFMRIQFW